jgi:hypothetical protein
MLLPNCVTVAGQQQVDDELGLKITGLCSIKKLHNAKMERAPIATFDTAIHGLSFGSCRSKKRPRTPSPG